MLTSITKRPLLASAAACALFLLAADSAFAQRTGVVRDMPIYDNGGKPDLTIDPQRFESQMEIVDRYFSPEDCAIPEGVVGNRLPAAPAFRHGDHEPG